MHSRSHSWRTRVPGPVFHLMQHTGSHSQLAPLTRKASVLVMSPLPFGSMLVMSRGIVQNLCWKPGE